jgi:hypothetical protein
MGRLCSRPGTGCRIREVFTTEGTGGTGGTERRREGCDSSRLERVVPRIGELQGRSAGAGPVQTRIRCRFLGAPCALCGEHRGPQGDRQWVASFPDPGPDAESGRFSPQRAQGAQREGERGAIHVGWSGSFRGSGNCGGDPLEPGPYRPESDAVSSVLPVLSVVNSRGPQGDRQWAAWQWVASGGVG